MKHEKSYAPETLAEVFRRWKAKEAKKAKFVTKTKEKDKDKDKDKKDVSLQRILRLASGSESSLPRPSPQMQHLLARRYQKFPQYGASPRHAGSAGSAFASSRGVTSRFSTSVAAGPPILQLRVEIRDGVYFQNLRGFSGIISVDCLCTGSPALTWTRANAVLFIENGAFIRHLPGATSAPIAPMPGESFTVLAKIGSGFDNTAVPGLPIMTVSQSSIIIFAITQFSNFSQDTIGDDGTCLAVWNNDASCPPFDNPGTWTGASWAATQAGNYYTIGANMYFVTIRISFTSSGSVTLSDAVRITLPATIGGSMDRVSATIGYALGVTLSSGSYLLCNGDSGNNFLSLTGWDSAGVGTPVVGSDLATPGEIQVSLTFWID